MDRHDAQILVLSAGFFGIFLAFNTTQALQSTLNGSVGSAATATLYAAFTLVCIPGPKLVNYFGPRNSMVIGGSMYVFMIAANIAILNLSDYVWAQYLVAIPFNLMVGVGAPLLWTGQAVYLNRVAEAKFSDENGEPVMSPGGKTPLEDTKGEFNGTFYSMFQANGVVGLVFAAALKSFASGPLVNTILFIVLTIAASIGVVILWNLPNIEAQEKVEPGKLEEGEGGAAQKDDNLSIAATITFLVRTPQMYCLVPIILFNGMSLGFMFSDFTKYVISEGIGDKNIGFALATFYGVNTIFTKLFGTKTVTDLFGRRGLYAVACILQVSFFLFLLFFHHKVIGLDEKNNMSNFVPPKTRVPAPNAQGYVVNDDHWVRPEGHAAVGAFSYVSVFALAALFAIGDAVLESVVPVTLQNFFAAKDADVNASAANQKMWQSLGFAAQFAIGALFPSLDVKETVLQHFQLKLYILSGWLVIGYSLAFYVLCIYQNPDDEVDNGGDDDMSQRFMRDSMNSESEVARTSSFSRSSLDRSNFGPVTG